MLKKAWLFLPGVLVAAGCSAGAVSVAETSGEEVIVAHPPSWTRGRLGVTGSYLIPYAHNPDITISVATYDELPAQIANLTDAHLEPGFMVGARYTWDASDRLSLALTAAYYRADTSVKYQVASPPMEGTYELDDLVGVPVYASAELGTLSTALPARWFIGLGGGYIWYGEEEQQGNIEPPKDEALAVVSAGVEFFGGRGLDVRLEASHVWLFENLRHQISAGLSINCGF